MDPRREVLLDQLRRLADLDYQYNAWVKGKFPPGIEYDDIAEVVHFFFDDTGLADEPESAIGHLLVDENELQAVKRLVSKLDIVIDNYAVEEPSEAKSILKSREWKQVVQAAKDSLPIFKLTPQ
jgi:hypothetical protein